MTTGPEAMVAETVENPLPAHRRRTFRDETPAGDDPRHPPLVRLGVPATPPPVNTIPFPAVAKARDRARRAGPARPQSGEHDP